jgi:hypothetical protein
VCLEHLLFAPADPLTPFLPHAPLEDNSMGYMNALLLLVGLRQPEALVRHNRMEGERGWDIYFLVPSLWSGCGFLPKVTAPSR